MISYKELARVIFVLRGDGKNLLKKKAIQVLKKVRGDWIKLMGVKELYILGG